jgi:hypothetical protein
MVWRGHSEAVLPLYKEEPQVPGTSIGGERLAALDQERMRKKYNYGEIVSR